MPSFYYHCTSISTWFLYHRGTSLEHVHNTQIWNHLLPYNTTDHKWEEFDATTLIMCWATVCQTNSFKVCSISDDGHMPIILRKVFKYMVKQYHYIRKFVTQLGWSKEWLLDISWLTSQLLITARCWVKAPGCYEYQSGCRLVTPWLRIATMLTSCDATVKHFKPWTCSLSNEPQ